MRKLIYYVAVTLDGYIAGPGGEIDMFVYEGDHMPWILERYPETVPGHLREPAGLTSAPPRVFDTVVMGRATHQVALDEGLSSGYPHLRQFVVTHTPHELPAVNGLTAVPTDPVDLVRGLKSEDSPLDIWLCGGGTLAGQLIDQIDEFRLKVNPVIAGAGIPLVAGVSNARRLTPRRRIDFESGVSYVEYTGP